MYPDISREKPLSSHCSSTTVTHRRLQRYQDELITRMFLNTRMFSKFSGELDLEAGQALPGEHLDQVSDKGRAEDR